MNTLVNENLLDNNSNLPKRDVGIVIHNLVLFETLKPIIEELKKENIECDIYVPTIEDEMWGAMSLDTFNFLKEEGYDPKRINKVPPYNYKVALYPYLPYYIELNSEYKVRYQYGMAKPEWNLDTWSINFDLIFCNGIDDDAFLKAYSLTKISGFIKYAYFNRKKSNYSQKIRLLYLPTYGEGCSIERIKNQLINLKDDFDITIKLHHGTTFLENERVNTAKEITNNIHDHRSSLVELIENTDLIISDDSGAIFDALATDTPVLIYKSTPYELFEGIPSIKQKLVDGDIVQCIDEETDIKQEIEKLLNDRVYLDKQRGFSEKAFPIKGKKTVDIVMKNIKDLLNDKADKEYLATHNRLKRKFLELNDIKGDSENMKLKIQSDIKLLSNEIEDLKNNISKLESDLQDKGYKINELNDDRSNLTQINDKLKFELEENDNKVEKLNKENATLNKENATLNKENATLNEENATLNEENATLNEENATLNEENATLNEENATLNEENATLNEENATLNEENATLLEKANNLSNEVNHLNQQLNWLTSKNNELNNTINLIYSTKLWKISNKIRKLLRNIGFYHVSKGLTVIKKYGFVIFFKKLKNKLLRFDQHKQVLNEKHLNTKDSNTKVLNWYEYKFLNYKQTRDSIYKLELDKINYKYKKDLVTIVLPVYNGEDMIESSIESLLNQTYKNFELIIINDGSKDRTGEIIDEYKKKDNRIKVIHQENRKIPRTLSRGFSIATGEFYTWTSADNIMHKNCIEEMVRYLKNNEDVAMVYANIRLIDGNGDFILNHGWYQEGDSNPTVNLPKSTLELNVYPNNTIGAAFMYRGIVTQLIGDYSSYKHTLEDYDYWMRINSLFKLKHIGYDNPIYDYRFHDKSLTSKDKELGITANRYKLMVLDDFRRDFYLSPMGWVINSEECTIISKELVSIIENHGHMVIDKANYRNLILSEIGIPIVCITILSESNINNYENLKVPKNNFRVLIIDSLKIDLSNINEEDWDCIITTKKIDNLPKLNNFKGVFKVEDNHNIFALIDLKYKNSYLYEIEKNIEICKKNINKISVIICTYKRSEKFVNALNSAINQSFDKNNYEIIVVNNDYTNLELKNYVYNYKDKYSTENGEFIKYVEAPLKGLSFARNVGMFEANSEILLYIDDDSICDYNCLEQTYNCFKEHPEAGVIGGEIKLNIPSPKPNVLLNGMEALWSQFHIDNDEYIESTHQWEYPYGANFAVRKDALLRIGGFRTNYGRKGNNFGGGEEIVVSSMMNTIGYKVGRNPKSKVIHDVDISRYTEEHVIKTIKASILTHYQLQKDLYTPMEANIDYDKNRIEVINEEMKSLQDKNKNGEYDLEILYKKSYLEAYKELVKVEKEDLENRKKF